MTYQVEMALPVNTTAPPSARRRRARRTAGSRISRLEARANSVNTVRLSGMNATLPMRLRTVSLPQSLASHTR
jgi:hypothetical protein